MKLNEIRDALKNFYKGDAHQEWMIDQRFNTILEQIYFNLGTRKPSKEKIMQEMRQIIVANGQDLQLPDPYEFPPIVQAVYHSLFTDQFVSYNHKELLSQIFLKQDPYIFKKMRELLQLLLKRIFEQLQNENISHELLIGHILAYLPFFAVEEGETFEIPIRINNEWKLVSYAAKKITLTPPALGSPITAIGLKSCHAPPLLLYKGTSYPSDEGFVLSILTDLNPGASVGAYAIYLAREKIAGWLADSKVKIFGLSLGGALALHTAVLFPENIDAVFAYNPPALLQNEMCKWQKMSPSYPTVHVIYHENDIVPATGFKWGDGWNIYRIYLDKKKLFLLAHFKCFIARRHHIILRTNPAQDERKWSRLLIASLHFILSFFFFPISLIIYFCKNISYHIKSLLFKRS